MLARSVMLCSLNAQQISSNISWGDENVRIGGVGVWGNTAWWINVEDNIHGNKLTLVWTWNRIYSSGKVWSNGYSCK